MLRWADARAAEADNDCATLALELLPKSSAANISSEQGTWSTSGELYFRRFLVGHSDFETAQHQ
jgi:hypothetical protein